MAKQELVITRKPSYRWQTCTMLPRASRDLSTNSEGSM